jgi:hypothetical protein
LTVKEQSVEITYRDEKKGGGILHAVLIISIISHHSPEVIIDANNKRDLFGSAKEKKRRELAELGYVSSPCPWHFENPYDGNAKHGASARSQHPRHC